MRTLSTELTKLLTELMALNDALRTEAVILPGLLAARVDEIGWPDKRLIEEARHGRG